MSEVSSLHLPRLQQRAPWPAGSPLPINAAPESQLAAGGRPGRAEEITSVAVDISIQAADIPVPPDQDQDLEMAEVPPSYL